jgi:hypothetical protein
VVLDMVGEIISEVADSLFPGWDEEESLADDIQCLPDAPMYYPVCSQPHDLAGPRAALPMPIGIPVARECPMYGPGIQTCVATTAAPEPTSVHVCVKGSAKELDITCGSTRLCCSKTDLKIADSVGLTLRSSEEQVDVTGPQLHARANCVCSDQKGTLILRGKVLLHFASESHNADVSAEYIEMNLHDGTIKVKP